MTELRGTLLLLALIGPVSSWAEQSSVEASIEKKSAWTGEAVPLTIKLFSPGPFDGTPAFDIPQLPLTAIIKTSGSPVVQSEEIDGDSWFSQQYEFVIYTQREGEIVLPSFQVRFEGKKTFTGDAEPMQGNTSELRFQSKRPPGTRELGFVVAVSALEISQQWNPDSDSPIKAGDVIERKISRHADGTTAMMFSPIDPAAPEGIQVYPSDPVVQDDTERGESQAERVDTIKYQFPRGGTFELPDITLTWWDTKNSSLQRQTLAGRSVEVVAAPPVAAVPTSSWRGRLSWIFIPIAAMGILGWLIRKPVVAAISRWHAVRNNPERLAARRLGSACQSNDAPAAYMAWMDWQLAMEASDPTWQTRLPVALAKEFRSQCDVLTGELYASHKAESRWDGPAFIEVFKRVCHALTQPAGSQGAPPALPKLNPT